MSLAGRILLRLFNVIFGSLELNLQMTQKIFSIAINVYSELEFLDKDRLNIVLQKENGFCIIPNRNKYFTTKNN